MNLSTPRLAVEGGDIRPDRARRYGSLFHALDQEVGAVSLPFNEADRASRGNSQSEGDAEALGPGEEAHVSQFGTYSHIRPSVP